MAEIVKDNGYGRTDHYEIVDAVPAGFFVWNIGEHAPAGYVPLCESMPDDEWSVNLDTLKAIKHDHAREILRAASYGGYTLKKCREIAAMGYAGTLDEYYSFNIDEYAMKRCAKALPYMEQMTWN